MPARYAILGLLAQRPMHGYEIDAEFSAGLREFCHVNISQIYAYLKSMEEAGWITHEVVLQERNPPKKVYSLTDEGHAELLRWLSEPAQQPRELRDEFLTKLYFARHISPVRVRELLSEQQAARRARLEEMDEIAQFPRDFFTRLLYEAGLRHIHADIEWLDWVEGQLDARDARSREAREPLTSRVQDSAK